MEKISIWFLNKFRKSHVVYEPALSNDGNAEDSESSRENLLENDEKYILESFRIKRRPAWPFWLLQGLLLALNIWLLIIATNANHNVWPRCEPTYRDISKSPAASVIHLENKYFDDGGDEFTITPYFGKPTNKIIKAWKELRKYSDVFVSEELMESLGRKEEGILLPDNSGYLATTQVYHDLHCLEQIHRWMYRDQYYPGLTEEEKRDQSYHLEHCLELLRQSTMCNADMSVITMKWGHLQPAPLANWRFPHTCKNWDDIERWGKEHWVEHIHDPDWLMHPVLGYAYANVSRLGVAHDDQ